MKIRVLHKDGKKETISLTGELTVVEGTYLNRLQDNRGLEHFFTPEGFYDGWGAGIPPVTIEDADTLLEWLESNREIEE